jgi:hypothetical protein
MMPETKTPLSAMEKELIINELQNSPVQITIVSFGAKDTASFPEPVIIEANLTPLSVTGNYLFICRNNINSPVNGEKIRVSFYARKLGYYFDSSIRILSSGMCIPLAASIYRREDVSKSPVNAKCTLTYNAKDSSINIDCIPMKDYDVFSVQKFESVPEHISENVRKMVRRFVQDSKKGIGGPVGNGLHLIPAARYLCSKLNPTDAIQGRKNPLDLLYLDETRLLLGDRDNSWNLELENEYTATFTFKLSALVTRTVALTCSVNDRLGSDEKKVCAVLKIIGCKEEDKRFLCERVLKK